MSGSVPGSQRSQYVLSAAQVQDLLLHELDLRNRIILELFLFCGIRSSECVTLEITGIDWAAARIRVMGKGYHGRGKPRIVPAPPFLLDKLRKYIGRRKTGYVFIGRDGPHLSRRSVQDITAAAGARIAFRQQCPTLKNLNPHTLRHTYARRMKDAGFDFEDMALLLGHENIFKTVTMYGTKTFDQVEEEMKKKIFVG